MPCTQCGSEVQGSDSRCSSCAGDDVEPEIRTDGGRTRGGTARRGASGSMMDRIPIGMSIGLGVAAYVVNLIVMLLFAVVEGGGGDLLTGGGFLLYGAHFVSIEAGPLSINAVDGLSTIPGPLAYLVPIVVLIGLGAVLGMRVGNRGTAADGAAAGAGMAGGYLVLAILGTFIFTQQFSSGFGASASAGPGLMMSALVMGLVYPIIFGGLGGFLGQSMN